MRLPDGRNVKVEIIIKGKEETATNVIHSISRGLPFILHDNIADVCLFDVANLALSQGGGFIKYNSVDDFQDAVKFALLHCVHFIQLDKNYAPQKLLK